MRTREAIILAGGLGQRLRPVVSDIPKPMAPVGDKPFLEYLLHYLSDYGLDHVVLSAGYRHEMIRDHFGNRFRNTELSYAIEDSPLGTGGGTRKAMELISGEEFFLLNGDTFFMVDLEELGKYHYAGNPDLTMSIRLMHDFDRYGSVEMDDSRITGFQDKKPLKSGYINGGVYVLRSDLFNRFTMPEKFSFEQDLLERNIENLNIHGFISTAYFIDIGIPEDYKKAQAELPGLME